ncbi:UNVERIFIED_CONTAM: hypothetical protein FKN15_073287 [Acipenser sinensis]
MRLSPCPPVPLSPCPPAPSSRYGIVLSFTYMETECTYDYLFVYDGDSYDSPLLASLSGSTLPELIEAKSGKMLLHLFSDANYNLSGFNASFSFSLCPRDCSGHGVCSPDSGRCDCLPGWAGEGCSLPACGANCSLHGTCDQQSGRCQCDSGFLAQSCDLSLNDNQGAGSWFAVSSGDGPFSPRTAAAGVFLNTTNALYVFGGFDLNRALGDLVMYNFTSNRWEERAHGPAARHSHTAVQWAGTMVIFGGQLSDGSLAGDVWQYSPLADSWSQLNQSESPGAPSLALLAQCVWGENVLLVAGGYSGTPRGDLVAYKVPIFVQQILVQNSEELGRWAVQQDKMSLRLERSGGERLFQNLERGNKYAVQIEGYLNNSGNGQTSELTLTWNRTGVPGGSCSGPPDYLCQCELGWTSNSSAVEQSGVECELDCGCNFHSTCETGLGGWDHCQDWTQGERCELCRPGSFGSAVERGGCSQCSCNGHGLEELGFCEGSGGVCHCGDATEGQHCEKNNGTCYLECGGRVFLPNVTSMALGSARGLGVSEGELSYCLWVLSASSHLQTCSGESQCPSMSLTIHPDINTNCTSNYVYVFDGLPEFLSDGVLRSDRNLIGAFCGTGRNEPITVAAASESWQGVPLDPSVSHAMAVAGGRLFLCGGFNGVALGRMLTLTLPSDPCLVLTTASSCNQSSGSCVWWRESCVSADTADRVTVMSNPSPGVMIHSWSVFQPCSELLQ